MKMKMKMKMKKKKKLRLYSVKSWEDAEYCVIVCHYSSKEAKLEAWRNSDWLQSETAYGIGFKDVRVKWLKDAFVDGLKVGIFDADVDILRRDTFTWLEYAECPICGNKDFLQIHEYDSFRFVSCYLCADQYEEDQLKKEDVPEKAIPYKDLKNKITCSTH